MRRGEGYFGGNANAESAYVSLDVGTNDLN